MGTPKIEEQGKNTVYNEQQNMKICVIFVHELLEKICKFKWDPLFPATNTRKTLLQINNYKYSSKQTQIAMIPDTNLLRSTPKQLEPDGGGDLKEI